ncbi:MAG: hypothetical protein AAF961_12880, partial [Planctomycetota bacterium]
GEIKPTIDRKDLKPQELAEMWESLGEENQDVDRLLWDMAAGRGDTVQYLAARLIEAPEKPDVDIEALVELLDSDRYSEREAAFKTMEGLGSRVEPQVREPSKNHPSVEVRTRLESLYQTWQSSAPTQADDLRHARAIEVLGRISTPAARDALQRITEGPSSYVAKWHAGQRLKEQGEQESR